MNEKCFNIKKSNMLTYPLKLAVLPWISPQPSCVRPSIMHEINEMKQLIGYFTEQKYC